MNVARSRVVIIGIVQGVWFCESTRRMASELGVSGWVRNRSDGNVEAVFEGPAEKVAAAVAWCRKGPERAVVTGIEEFEEVPEGLTGFEIASTEGY